MSSTPRSIRWETLTKKQFDAIDREHAVVFVTCSPMEVHGPHLPIGADCLEGEGLAERTLRFLPERHHSRTFLKLPFVWAACDGVPQPGTVAFRPSTTMAFLEDMGRSLALQGFRNVMVSNFHGSPRHFLSIETACERVSRAHGIRMVSIFSMMLTRLKVKGSELGDVLGHIPGVVKADLAGDTHAGFVETSQLLALHPDWVDPDYKSLPRRTVPKAGGFIAGIKGGMRYFSAETYSGAPAGAYCRDRRADPRHARGSDGRGDRGDPGRDPAAGAVALAVLGAATCLREPGGGAGSGLGAGSAEAGGLSWSGGACRLGGSSISSNAQGRAILPARTACLARYTDCSRRPDDGRSRRTRAHGRAPARRTRASRTRGCSTRSARVPREAFVPEELAEFAYEDAPLPIAGGQTISQPYIVAVTVEALGAAAAASACSRSARARATRRRCSRGSPARSTPSSVSAPLAETARERLGAARLRQRARAVRRRHARLGRARAVRRDRRRGRRARGARGPARAARAGRPAGRSRSGPTSRRRSWCA